MLWLNALEGLFKKSVQQGRSHFNARSVHFVREHEKMVRTPLVDFFNSRWWEHYLIHGRVKV